MKKLLILSFAFSFALSLTGCINQQVDVPIIEPEEIVVEPIAVETEDVEDADEETMDIKVFFPTTKDNENMMDCRKTDFVIRKIPKAQPILDAIMEQLFTGPTEEEKAEGYKAHFVTKETSNLLKRIFINGDANKGYVIYLDWDGSIIEKIQGADSSCGSSAFLAPIEATLTKLPIVSKVVHAIDGSPAKFYEWMQSSCEYDDICDETPYKNPIGENDGDVIDFGYKEIGGSSPSYQYSYNNKEITTDQIRAIVPNEHLYYGSNVPTNKNGSIVYFQTTKEIPNSDNEVNTIYSYNLETKELKKIFEKDDLAPFGYAPIAVANDSKLIVIHHINPGSDPCIMSYWVDNGYFDLYSIDLNSSQSGLKEYKAPKSMVLKEKDNEIKCLIDIGYYD